MRNSALLSASALILALGVGSASAQPTTEQLMSAGRAGASSTSAPTYEGRAASLERQAVATDELIYQPHSAGR